MILTISIKKEYGEAEERLTLSRSFNHKEPAGLRRAIQQLGYDLISLATKQGWIW